MALSEPTNVSEAIAKAAMAAVESHPLHREAISWVYCPSDIFSMQKAFVERTRLPEDEKSKLRQALADVEELLVVSFWTSDKKPEPLSGTGKQYVFLIHPKSLCVLHADIGTWRS